MKRHNMRVNKGPIKINPNVKPRMVCQKCKAVIPERNVWLKDGIWFGKCRLRPMRDVYKKRGKECGRVEYFRVVPPKPYVKPGSMSVSYVQQVVKNTLSYSSEDEINKLVEQAERGLDDYINGQEAQHEANLPD